MPCPYQAYYFDSMGVEPNKCIRDALLNKFPKVVYNSKQVQPLLSRFCGLFVILFIHMMTIGLDFNKFIVLLDQQSNPDSFVSAFVKELIKEIF